MTPNRDPGPPPRAKIPKDGQGPRGAPECYYTSRVLNSTIHYVRFVKKLRLLEDEVRRGDEMKIKKLKDKQTLDFFTQCDRRSLINKVSQRVDLCTASYEMDLQDKRKRLEEMLSADEEMHIRAFIVQNQTGVEEAWQDKQKRLEYLLAKRKKEHEDKFKDTPLSKCAHVLPCVFKLRAKEDQEIQLYQMREKQMRKMADAEMDKMWYDVTMKESEALAARMELDAMERLRRDTECKQHSDHILELRRQQRAREQAQLKQESLDMKAKWLADDLKEAAEEQKHQEHRNKVGQERKDAIRERKETFAKLEAHAQFINDTWDSLAGQGLPDEKAKEDLRKQKKRELDECNRMMVKMKDRIAEMKFNNEPLIMEEGQRRQDAMDLKRCLYRKWVENTNKETYAAEPVARRHEEEKKQDGKAQQEKAKEKDYQRQLKVQLDQLVKHKELTDAQARKLYQRDLLDQINYNKSLKEKARQEAIEETKKCKIAAEEYQREIAKMLHRPFFSEDVHPFMKQMSSGLKIKPICPCSYPTYCLDPVAK